jgi:predicted outer membrane protein
MPTPHVPDSEYRAPATPSRLGRACGLAILGLAGSWAMAPAVSTAAPSPSVSVADRTFLQVASQGNRFEIASGDIAAQITRKAHTTPAKKLAIMAGMIVSDHQKSQRRLATLATKLDVNISRQPDPVQQFLVSQIASYAAALTTGTSGASSQTNTDPNKTNNGDMGSEGGKKGSNGNATTTPATDTTSTTGTPVGTLRGFYLKVQAAVHQQAIQNYSAIAIATKNKDVRAYACQSLPVLRRHLSTVQQALGSAQPELAMSGAKALAAKADAACRPVGASG